MKRHGNQQQLFIGPGQERNVIIYAAERTVNKHI